MIDFLIWGGFGVFAIGMYFLSQKYGKKDGGLVDRHDDHYQDFGDTNDDSSNDDSGSDDSGSDDSSSDD